MNAARWNGDDFEAMTEWANNQRIFTRRLIFLLHVASCRHIWGLLGPLARRYARVLEKYADGQATIEQVRGAFPDDLEGDVPGSPARLAFVFARAMTLDDDFMPAFMFSRNIRRAVISDAILARILRETLGDPFFGAPEAGLCAACGSGRHDRCGGQVSASGIRCGCQVCWGKPPPLPPPAWITPTVCGLALAAYQKRGKQCNRCKGPLMFQRGMYCVRDDHGDLVPCPTCRGTGWLGDGSLDSSRLAILADALEEAGCNDGELLWHLRISKTSSHTRRCGTEFRGCEPNCPKAAWEKNGPHYRGCWALDFVLEKR